MVSPTVALICGVSGQDGAYLARYLLRRGYEVHGTSRDANSHSFENLDRLGIKDKIHLLSMDPNDFPSVLCTLEQVCPKEIYFLSGQSSVSASFDDPSTSIKSIVLGTLNVLEGCRLVCPSSRLYHAGSSECFGDTLGDAADERTPFQPRSPYAVAKSSAFWLVDNYRKSYGLYACTGLLFNHESPLRHTRFVTQKVIQAAKRISLGSREKLTLGQLEISRDWGWAPEYVDAMWKMLHLDDPMDFVIATGKTNSLETFISHAFGSLDLDWKDHVVSKSSLMRPCDLSISRANPDLAGRVLNWHAEYNLRDVVTGMLEDEE